MRQTGFRDQPRATAEWSKYLERLVYLPGAAVMLYGLWLTLNA